ncbi:hypothetical protein D0962_06705 [Leptolyngbyaceae cyanobacterium CCMR0082]|uniref:Uncharacterized protein n=2 Tax=Adonisia turfae TaxID=2950184 RepID=A0A6M0S343_9CYAN|nr:hypothetical protein [Adonisia turfae CCMR0081]NEZ62473.1 hypothetical protein [Adonisia turfae CCMR0082]
MNERFIYLSNRIIDELNKIDLATQRAFSAWQDFQNSGNEFFLDSYGRACIRASPCRADGIYWFP